MQQPTDREAIRTYRVCLNPAPDQLNALAQHAGSNRWAYNYALARKIAAHTEFTTIRARLALMRGVDPENPAVLKAFNREAGRLAPRIPTYMDNMRSWRVERDLPHPNPREDGQLLCNWWKGINSYAWSSGMQDADAAFRNWFDSQTGNRAGRKVGYPRFKRKGRSRDSFKIFHDVKKPGIRFEDARHLRLPTIGTVRLHSNVRRVIRLQRKGLITVRSVTVTREGSRWFASVLVTQKVVEQGPSRRQVSNGAVGVDLGVKELLTLSTGEVVANDRLGRSQAESLAKAQRKLARSARGSNRRRKLARKVGDLQARISERRKQRLHQVTKTLTTNYAAVILEDLNVSGMTRSSSGTVENPGRRVRQKSGLNREILDVSFGEFRRQVEYKSDWYGSQAVVIDRFEPTSKTCSECGHVKPDLKLADRMFTCPTCGHSMDRDLNAAINIAVAGLVQLATSAPEGARLAVARTKPRDRVSVRNLPDTCDERGSRGSNRDARGPRNLARPDPRVETRRLPVSHHSGVILNHPPPRH